MNEQYQLYIKNFEDHLKELEGCKIKLLERSAKFERLLFDYDKKLNQLSDKFNLVYENFKINVENIDVDLVDNTLVKISLLREEFSFFVNTYNVLATNETDDKKLLKTELSRLNLLLEATTKISMFIEDRKSKLIEKYTEEDHKYLNDIYTKSMTLSSEINKIVCVINTKSAFTFSSELEVSSRFQTLEAVCSDIKKKMKYRV